MNRPTFLLMCSMILELIRLVLFKFELVLHQCFMSGCLVTQDRGSSPFKDDICFLVEVHNLLSSSILVTEVYTVRRAVTKQASTVKVDLL